MLGLGSELALKIRVRVRVGVRFRIMNAKCMHSKYNLIPIMTDAEVMKFSNCRSCSGCTDRSQHSCGGQTANYVASSYQ